ncbi:MAG: polyhydroxyalkanoic acid system family protein [Myxococcota bacterium]|nr:polyhydroxyalkanoic acid system family protein [Myxococcota bacterium]
MATIRITESHTLGTETAKSRVSVFEEMLGKFGVKLSWSGHKATFKGIGVSGSMSVTDNDVTVEIKLGMMARAAGVDGDRLKGSISRRLREAFDTE